MALVQVPEGARPQPGELGPILAGSGLAVEDHDVVEVVARHRAADWTGAGWVGADVGAGEVRRPGQHSCPRRARVADGELLMEDRRVQIGDHVDPGTQQGRMDDPVLLMCLSRSPRVPARTGFEQVVALQDDLDSDTTCPGGQDLIGDGSRIQLLDGDLQRLSGTSNEVADHRVEIIGGPQDGRAHEELEATHRNTHAPMILRWVYQPGRTRC